MIKAKYLKNMSMEGWLRKKSFSVKGTSIFWNGFIRSLLWLSCKLGWKFGNGSSIKLGIDPISSLNTSFTLSEDLRDYLMDLGICTLNQGCSRCDGVSISSYRFTVVDLNLGGRWKTKWTSYVKRLSHGGIILNEDHDSILWIHNVQNGDVSSSLAYDLIIYSLLQKY